MNRNIIAPKIWIGVLALFLGCFLYQSPRAAANSAVENGTEMEKEVEQQFEVRGTVTDASNGEPQIGRAHV